MSVQGERHLESKTMDSAMISSAPKQELLRDLLKQVSRLFYTTLVIVPADVRDQVSLAYLFARAADTIADTDLIDRPRRMDFLRQLKEQFVGDQIVWGQVQDIQRAVGPLQH